MVLAETVRRLIGYKVWANEITFSAVKSLPEDEATKERKTRYKNMICYKSNLNLTVYRCSGKSPSFGD